MDVNVYIDGGARGNPGPAAAGVVIRNAQNKTTLFEAGYFLGTMTNNSAEYQGLIRGIEQTLPLDVSRANIYCDSELIVKQITGEYRVKSAGLQPLHEKAQRLLLQLESWQIKHLPREENKRADQLVNMALDAKRDVMAAGNSAPAGDEPAEEADQTEQVHWAVQLMTDKGKSCPLGCPSGERFVFGPHTPAGSSGRNKRVQDSANRTTRRVQISRGY